MDEEAFGGCTDLPGVQEPGFDDAIGGLVQIDIAQEASRVFATQFQRCAGQPGAHGTAADGNAGGNGTGK
ncbi:hypothetical protein D3C78_1576850 [compost metagenome]